MVYKLDAIESIFGCYNIGRLPRGEIRAIISGTVLPILVGKVRRRTIRTSHKVYGGFYTP